MEHVAMFGGLFAVITVCVCVHAHVRALAEVTGGVYLPMVHKEFLSP